jgi:hypothetical protein
MAGLPSTSVPARPVSTIASCADTGSAKVRAAISAIASYGGA